ncbi:uncharacterized protein BDV17DRAFT_276766 [Aspergillus undulatus]|uniref:uncharacterized protein n=1 Tax=Aspergillus undulatus TaxID=1810928 RepID=UPI003CCD5464
MSLGGFPSEGHIGFCYWVESGAFALYFVSRTTGTFSAFGIVWSRQASCSWALCRGHHVWRS